jgi:tetratricopeptide (TPR) repeat protein
MSFKFNEFSDRVVRLATQIQSLFEQGRGEEAIGVLLAEIGPVYGVPRHAPRVVKFGTRLLRAGDPQKALAYFDNVLSPNDHCDWGLYGRALAHRLLGQDAQAEADLAQAIAIAEDRQQWRRGGPYGHATLYRIFSREIVWSHIADLPLYHLALGNGPQAEQMIRDALSQAPFVLFHVAAQRLKDLTLLFPDDTQAQSLLALLQERLQQGDAPDSIDPSVHQLATIQAAFDPEHTIESVVARQQARIQSLFDQGQVEEAIWELDQVIGILRKPPHLATAGAELLRTGDLQEAVSYFTRFLSANDSSDWSLYGRGLAHRLLGDEAQAQADLAQAVAVAETHQQARRFDFDGPVARMYARYRQDITWAHRIDLPLYHLALGNAQQAEQMVRDALSQAPVALLPLAARGLEDLAGLFPDDAQARALRVLLQGHLQERQP